jgi:uncharacterized protein
MSYSIELLDPISLTSPHHGRPVWADLRLRKDGTPKPLVLFVHGFKGFKDWGPFPLVANQFAQAGFAFLKINLSHNGTTPEFPQDFVDLEAFGRNTFTKELEDLEIMLDQLPQQLAGWDGEIDWQRLYLIGHSRGGGIGLIKANEDDRIKKMATWAGMNTLRMRYEGISLEEWQRNRVVYISNARTQQQMPLYYDIVEDLALHAQRLDVEKAVRALRKPLLVAHGTADETLPYQMALQIKEWNPRAQLLLVESASHTFGATHPWVAPSLPADMERVVEETIKFFKKDSQAG